eukprot:3182378-Pyramimonas_sp.AAC.1
MHLVEETCWRHTFTRERAPHSWVPARGVDDFACADYERVASDGTNSRRARKTRKRRAGQE